MSIEQRYLMLLFTSLIATITLIAGFNYAVDPYGIFAMPRIPGFNALKSHANQRGPLAKAHAIETVQPRGLIIGNSRAEIGFDPEHPAWPADTRPVYNAALPGTGIDTSLNYLHYPEAATLRHVVLGIEFLDFRVNPALPVQQPQFKPLLTPKDRFRDNFDALFSIDSALHAIATVRAQHQPYPTSLTAFGFNPMREYTALARNEGYYALFRQRNKENARNFSRQPKALFSVGTHTSSDFETFKAVLRFASEKKIKLDLVIYPYHAEMLVLFEQTGLWPLFQDWKREIVSLVSAHIAHYPDSSITLWDFSSPTPLTTEAIPTKNELSASMQGYWEAGHFKKELGDKVLNRVLGSANTQPQEQFGTILTPANIESHLAKTQTALAQYVKSHPTIVSELEQLIPKVKYPTK